MTEQYELQLNVSTVAPPRRRRTKRPVESVEPTSRRIRVDIRNRTLIARYYYWTEIKRRRFDDVMNILSVQEFFVEERTISNALLDFSDYLNDLYDAKADARALKREYPSWCWDN